MNKQVTILLVEDNPRDLELTLVALNKSNLANEVVVARDGVTVNGFPRGTIISVGLLAEQLFPGQGAALGVLWRDKQIEYTRLVTTSNEGEHYKPFWELTRAGLRYACKRLALDLTAAHEDKLMNQYRHLSAFPENREVLQALKERRIVTGILSNGDPQMLGIAVRSAGEPTRAIDRSAAADKRGGWRKRQGACNPGRRGRPGPPENS